MKVNKAQAIAFLLALGFTSAAEWDNERIATRLKQVPERLTEEAVPKEYHAFYNELKTSVAAGKSPTIVEEDSAPKAKAKAKEAAANAKKGEGKPAAKKGGKEKATPKPKKEKKERPRDAYGSVIGSIRASINKTFSKEWKTDKEVSKEAGVTLRQARSRLRRMVKAGKMEKERLIRYRLLDEKKSK